MTLSWLCIVWVLASVVVAMLPMRYQYVLGVLLLLAAPVLIGWIALTVHWALALCGLAAFVSMYRNPPRYFPAGAR